MYLVTLVHAGFVFHLILFQNSNGYYTFNVNGNNKKRANIEGHVLENS